MPQEPTYRLALSCLSHCTSTCAMISVVAAFAFFLLFSAPPAASETQLTEQFIRRLVEPAIQGKPFDVVDMRKDATNSQPYVQYSDDAEGFSVNILQENDSIVAISVGIVEGRNSSVKLSPLLRDLAAFSITREDQLYEFINDFDVWAANAQSIYHAQDCVPEVVQESTGREIYARAVKFVTADGKSGFASFRATEKPYSNSDNGSDLFLHMPQYSS